MLKQIKVKYLGLFVLLLSGCVYPEQLTTSVYGYSVTKVDGWRLIDKKMSANNMVEVTQVGNTTNNIVKITAGDAQGLDAATGMEIVTNALEASGYVIGEPYESTFIKGALEATVALKGSTPVGIILVVVNDNNMITISGVGNRDVMGALLSGIKLTKSCKSASCQPIVP